MTKPSYSLKIICLSLLSALLIACGGGGGGGAASGGGGGGGGGSSAPTINFVTSGTITKYYFLGSLSFSNAATSPTNPNSTVSYTSSVPSVATVNQFTGDVSILTTGTTIITASVTAEGNYTAGSNSYTLVVTNEVPFTAWVGTNDTKVDLPTATSGLQFYSSTDKDCRGCAGNYSVSLSGTTVTDTVAKLNTTSYYTLERNGQPSDPAAVSQSRFSARKGHELITYQNRLWLIGGVGAGLQNDAWSSSNGEAWKQENSAAFNSGINDHQLIIDSNSKIRLIGGLIAGTTLNPNIYVGPVSPSWGATASLPGFGKRSGHQISTFNGKHWLTGGSTGATFITTLYTADTWTSTDGLIWTNASPGTSFTARRGHQTAEFNGKLWLIGGYNSGGYLNDIWSFNGSTWTQETATTAIFSARRDHRLITFNNKLWLIGGEDGSVLADIWSSSNGTAWTQETATAAFGPVFDHSLAVFNNRLWLAGGQISAGGTLSNEVWSSADGSTWILENSPSEFTGRSNVQATSFASKLWLFGGEAETTNNDIWSSTTGISWAEQSSSAAFTARTNHQIAELNNTLWLSSGQLTNANNANDIWSSSNGTDWTQATTSAAFPVRSGHQMLVDGAGQLWILGGWQGSSTYLDDAWSSPDGTTWTQHTASGDPQSFGERGYHQSVVYNGKLWVIGGYDGTLRKDDVWSFNTATNTWTQVTANAAFSARRKHEVVVFGGKMWLIGGEEFGGGSTPLNDIWSSTDGNTWAPEGNAEFPARHSHSVVEHGGELYLIGGIDANGKKLKDVWKSSDGISWRRAFSNSIVFQ